MEPLNFRKAPTAMIFLIEEVEESKKKKSKNYSKIYFSLCFFFSV